MAGTSAGGASNIGARTRVSVTVVPAQSYTPPQDLQRPVVVPEAKPGRTVPGKETFVISCEGVPQPIHAFPCQCSSLCAPGAGGYQYVVDLREIIKVYDGSPGDAALNWEARSRGSTRTQVEAGLSGETAEAHCIDAGPSVKCAVPVWLAMHLLSRAPSPWGRLWQHGLMSSPGFNSWFSENCCSPEDAAGAGGAGGAGGEVPLKPAGQAYTGASATPSLAPFRSR